MTAHRCPRKLPVFEETFQPCPNDFAPQFPKTSSRHCAHLPRQRRECLGIGVVLSVRPGPFHVDPGQCANQVLKAENLEHDMHIIRQVQMLKAENLEKRHAHNPTKSNAKG